MVTFEVEVGRLILDGRFVILQRNKTIRDDLIRHGSIDDVIRETMTYCTWFLFSICRGIFDAAVICQSVH